MTVMYDISKSLRRCLGRHHKGHYSYDSSDEYMIDAETDFWDARRPCPGKHTKVAALRHFYIVADGNRNKPETIRVLVKWAPADKDMRATWNYREDEAHYYIPYDQGKDCTFSDISEATEFIRREWADVSDNDKERLDEVLDQVHEMHENDWRTW